MALIKTQSVLDIVADGRRYLVEDYGKSDDLVWFERKLDSGKNLTRELQVVVDRQTFVDLGEPRKITITIESGDVLNKSPDPDNFRGSGVGISEPLP